MRQVKEREEKERTRKEILEYMSRNKRGEQVHGPATIINQTGENEEIEEEIVEPNLRLSDIAEIGFQNMEKNEKERIEKIKCPYGQALEKKRIAHNKKVDSQLRNFKWHRFDGIEQIKRGKYTAKCSACKQEIDAEEGKKIGRSTFSWKRVQRICNEMPIDPRARIQTHGKKTK